MRKGTTPTINISLPYDTSALTKLNIAFAQKGNVVLEKGLTDVALEDNKISFALTEAETLSLEEGQLNVQIRIELDNKKMASNIVTTKVDGLIKGGSL